MTKKDVVKAVLNGKKPDYVPWQIGFTKEATEAVIHHYGTVDLQPILQNHIHALGFSDSVVESLGNECVQDCFGVVWDRSVDKDIGVVKGQVLEEPTLSGFKMPNPVNPLVFSRLQDQINIANGRFVQFCIGFSLYERAWTLRGMENLMMDFYDNPDFVNELLNAIADYNIAQIREALKYDGIDAIHFGDDWGQQKGLQMGPAKWREFILPVLKRMYKVAKDAGKYVTIHSCGDVHEVFDDLIDAGLNCFNPFQPEVMDVDALINGYRGRLSFWGGLSTQKSLPFGSKADVEKAVNHLLDIGKEGGLILAPAHSVKRDVPVENIVALIETVQNQIK